MSSKIREVINQGPMSRFQMRSVAICVGLNMLDGFDVLVMAFTGPAISADWGLTGAQLGVLLSAGLFGMAGGSLFLAPWADRFGRRAITLICLVIISVGLLLSAAAHGVAQLAAWRLLTGVGIGGILASISVITAEYSSNRWRSNAISLQVIGYPIGATIGGSIAAVLITRYGWRSAFLFGAVASLLMIPVVVRHLPESLDFLLAKRPRNALQRLNMLLRRMHHEEVSQFPEPPAIEPQQAQGNPLTRLFSGPLARSTVLIWSSFFLLMFTFYFVLSWTPKLLVAAGLSAQQGVTGGVLLNLGGIIGGGLFGYISSRVNLRKLAAAYFIMGALTLVLFGLVASNLTMAFAIALLMGACITGCMAGLYALAPTLYPAAVRTTGMGWAIGIGRIGAILAPTIVGFLIDGGWKTSDLYYAFAIPLVIAMPTVLALGETKAAGVVPAAAGAIGDPAR
jgi:benzoate transport